MKTRITLIIASFAFVISNLFAGPAGAEVERSKLLGYWSGDLVVFFHGNATGMKIEVNFQKDGKFSLKQLANGKTDEALFEVKGEKILITDGKGKDTFLTDVTLTDNNLRARFEATEKADEQNLSIEIALTRGKAKADDQPKSDAKKKGDAKKQK